MVVDLGAAAVRRGDGDDVAFGIVEIAGFASERVALYGNAAVAVAFAVAFAVAALSVGVDAVGETAQFFAVASVNGGQIAVAVVVVAHQFLAVEGDVGEAVHRRRERRFSRGRLKVGFQTTSMLTVNEIVKEQMVQTTSKKVLRSSEKQKPRVYVRSVYALFNSSIINIYIRNILIFK